MIVWPKEELRRIAHADDMRIAPFREDGMTCGTPTWILSVEVDELSTYVATADEDRFGIRPRCSRRRDGSTQEAG